MFVGVVLVAGVSTAAHCDPDLSIGSGPARLPENPASTGALNPAPVGCLVDDEALDTNLLLPQATFIVVVATDNGKGEPTTGAVTFAPGGTVQIDWSKQAPAVGSGRYVSQDIPMPANATTVTATARVPQPDGSFKNRSITYTRIV
jgi:hypothetical protein